MADSQNTRRALARALKELMGEQSFDKIKIAQICDKCSLNRQSFYYHFKDKYDLLNWIFDNEFANQALQKTYEDSWVFLTDLAGYLYKERRFYRQALQIRGQNSFTRHMDDLLRPHLTKRLQILLNRHDVIDFHTRVISDVFICAIIRWLTVPNPMPPATFLTELRFCIEKTAQYICHDLI